MTPNTILYELDEEGGFTVFDERTGLSSYAYPTSPYAIAAKTKPAAVAAEMAWSEHSHSGVPRLLDSAHLDKRRGERLRASARARAIHLNGINRALEEWK